jgi:hypothetical protein
MCFIVRCCGDWLWWLVVVVGCGDWLWCLVGETIDVTIVLIN